jgi:hypothetical protein
LLSSIQKQKKPKKTVPFKADFTVTTEVLQALRLASRSNLLPPEQVQLHTWEKRPLKPS